MDFHTAVNLMDTGFCLWVGAGLTVQVAGNVKDAPQWRPLTEELERLAEIRLPDDWSFPERLEACSKELSERAFQAELRRRYYTHLGRTVLRRAKEFADREDFIPPEVWQIASLGQAANPIVNFNIEPLSSVLIGRPAGPMRVLSYVQPNQQVLVYDEPSHLFRRLVYHPHGLVTRSCVMTKSQYKSMGATLAFRLATHAAFGSILAIVGMSLEDEYLREQITAFRNDLKEIFWFNSHFEKAPAIWAAANGVDMLQVKWPEFWECWFKDRGFEVDEAGLCAAWYRVLREAQDEITGGAALNLCRNLASVGIDRTDLLERSKQLGEPGRSVEDAEELTDVVDKIAARIQGKGFCLPQIGTTF